MTPPRVHVASDDGDFDLEFLSHLQAEGFQTTYIPLLPLKPSTPTKLDLTPLRHIADDLEHGESYAIIAFGEAATACLDFYSTTQPNVAALIAYYPTAITNPALKFPPGLKTITHLAATQSFAPAFPSYTYENVQPGFAEHDLDDYDRTASSLSWSRTLGLLRSALNVTVDLESIWETHLALKSTSKDPTATVNTLSASNPSLTHIPTLTGGTGHSDLLAFYRDYLLPNPPSTTTKLLSRTIGTDRIVDEFLLSFEHTHEIPWMLPGVPPTGRRVSVAVVAVGGFRGGKVERERVYWDQASVLVQVGLLDPGLVPEGMRERGVERLPVVGAEAARKVLDEGVVASNGLLKGRKGGERGEGEVRMPERPKQVAGAQ